MTSRPADSTEAALREPLARRIAEIVAAKGLTQREAAARLDVDQPKISALSRGRLAGFSTERLVRFLNALDHDVTIVVEPRPTERRAARSAVVVRRKTMRSAAAFEALARLVPGVRGYLKRESARDADKDVRDGLVRALRACRAPLGRAKRAAIERGDLSPLPALDRAESKLDRVAATIRFAARGYRGLFDSWKVDLATIEALGAAHLAIFDRIEALKPRVEALGDVSDSSLVERGADDLSAAIDEIGGAFAKRREIVVSEPSPTESRA